MAYDRISQRAIELVAENRIRHAILHQPIPDIDEPYDPDWWIRRWVRRESLSRQLIQGLRPKG